MSDARVRFYGELWKGKTTAAIRRAARETARYAVKVLSKENRALAYKTGKMSKSWVGELADKGILLTNNAPYSGYVIGGTRYMKARPILQNKLPDIQDKFRKELGKEIGTHMAIKLTKALDSAIDWSKLTGGIPND